MRPYGPLREAALIRCRSYPVSVFVWFGIDFGLEDVCDPGCGGAKGYGCQSFECSRWLVLGQSFVHDRRDLLLCDSFDGVGDAKLFFPVEFVPQSWSVSF